MVRPLLDQGLYCASKLVNLVFVEGLNVSLARFQSLVPLRKHVVKLGFDVFVV